VTGRGRAGGGSRETLDRQIVKCGIAERAVVGAAAGIVAAMPAPMQQLNQQP
jgi:transketolase C-terminal domain/subunit